LEQGDRSQSGRTVLEMPQAGSRSLAIGQQLVMDLAGRIVESIDVVHFVAQEVNFTNYFKHHLFGDAWLAEIHRADPPTERKWPISPDGEQLVAFEKSTNAITPASIRIFAVSTDRQGFGIDDFHGRRRLVGLAAHPLVDLRQEHS